eukprot:TRINITY_DN11084_c0_g1_i1.p1 TRINITY_DN11084_c0_g1~~TRINITY_DN11084_c0_g1_i1.p1  ORF type:complete len:456 (+),score=124.06 TRINITY_DN11084_c0_g1_i1:71-1438(+)
MFFFFFQAEDGIRDAQESRGLGDVYKRQVDSVVNKIYTYETKYVNDLRILLKTYFEPILPFIESWLVPERAEGTRLSSHEIQNARLFRMFQQYVAALSRIYSFHSNELMKLAERRTSASSGSNVIEVAVGMLKSFCVHAKGSVTMVLNRNTQVRQLIEGRAKVDLELRDFMWKQEKSIKQGMSLSGYMFATLQSVTSYAMLAHRLVENMPVSHLQYQEVLELEQMFEKHNYDLNHSSTCYREILKLQNQIPDFPINLAKECRRLARRSRMEQIVRVSENGIENPAGETKKQVEVVLLSDMCVICEYTTIQLQKFQQNAKSTMVEMKSGARGVRAKVLPAKTENKSVYRVTAVIAIETLHAQPVPGSEFVFELLSPESPPIILAASSKAERDDWISEIQGLSLDSNDIRHSAAKKLQAVVRGHLHRRSCRRAQCTQAALMFVTDSMEIQPESATWG